MQLKPGQRLTNFSLRLSQLTAKRLAGARPGLEIKGKFAALSLPDGWRPGIELQIQRVTGSGKILRHCYFAATADGSFHLTLENFAYARQPGMYELRFWISSQQPGAFVNYLLALNRNRHARLLLAVGNKKQIIQACHQELEQVEPILQELQRLQATLAQLAGEQSQDLARVVSQQQQQLQQQYNLLVRQEIFSYCDGIEHCLLRLIENCRSQQRQIKEWQAARRKGAPDLLAPQLRFKILQGKVRLAMRQQLTELERRLAAPGLPVIYVR